MDDIRALLERLGANAVSVRLKTRVGRSERVVGEPVEGKTIDELLDGIDAELARLPPGSYKICVKNGAGEQVGSCTVRIDADEERQDLAAPSAALAAVYPDQGDSAVDAVIQATRDAQEHNRAREAALDGRFNTLIELQQATIRIQAEQIGNLTGALIDVSAQAAAAKIEAAEAEAAAAGGSSGSAIERAIDRVTEAYLAGQGIDADAAELLKNPALAKLISNPKARAFLASDHATELLEAFLNQDEP